MCMKYESEYGRCFDLMMFEEGYEEYSLSLFLKDWYGLKIVHDDTFRNELYKLFEKWHEDGVIRPMTEVEIEEAQKHMVARGRAQIWIGD